MQGLKIFKLKSNIMNIKSYADFINEGSRYLKKGFYFSSLSKGHEIRNKKTGKIYVVQSVGSDSAEIKDKNSSKFIGFTIMSLKDYEPVDPGLYEGSMNEGKGRVSIESLSIGNTYKDIKGYPVKVVDISGTGNSWKITIKDEHGNEKIIKTSLDKGVNLFERFVTEKKAGDYIAYEGSLNEGQFSWMAQDTGNQIGSERENTITVYMYDNTGNKWKETSYDGYGRFGGKDYYELLAQMNGLENADRQDGVDLAHGKMKIKGDVLFPALVENPNFNWKRHDFTQEPENDPDQSWYKEPEDDYYDEY